jgi:hypothetical protein
VVVKSGVIHRGCSAWAADARCCQSAKNPPLPLLSCAGQGAAIDKTAASKAGRAAMDVHRCIVKFR